MKNTMKSVVKMILLGTAIAILISPANAAVLSNTSNDITLSVFVPCAAGGAGELVDLSGPLHTLLTFTIINNNASGVIHFQPHGISGIGETTGLKYQATGVTSTSFKFSLQNGQVTQTFINRFDIIGQGPGNNFGIQETAHITLNADGTVTVFFDNFRVECN